MSEKPKISRPVSVLPVLKRWAGARQENFILLTLDGAGSVIRVYHLTKGLVNRTIIHPRECFYPAIKDNASSVMIAHNHPSGNCHPSNEDIDITKRLFLAGHLMGIKVLDHIIFAKNYKHYSFRENGFFDELTNLDITRWVEEYLSDVV